MDLRVEQTDHELPSAASAHMGGSGSSSSASKSLSSLLRFVTVFTLALGGTWLFLLSYDVGLYAVFHGVPCDEPLAAFLCGAALALPCFAAIAVWHWGWARANEKRVPDWQMLRCIVGAALALRLATMILLLLGNVWLLSSHTCRESSRGLRPSPKSIMLDLFDATCLVVAVFDAEFLVGGLLLAVDLANAHAQGWHAYRRVNRVRLPLEADYANVVTWRGIFYWYRWAKSHT